MSSLENPLINSELLLFPENEFQNSRKLPILKTKETLFPKRSRKS